MSLNPYEAPQTTSLTEPRGIDPTRDLADVLRGAKLITYAIALHLGALLVEATIFTFGNQLDWGWLQWVATIVSTISMLMRIWGLWHLRRVPQDTRAKPFILMAFTTLLLSISSYWLLLGIAFLLEEFYLHLLGYLICVVFGWFSHLLLLWGLRRVGHYYAVPRLSRLAQCSFYYQLFVNGFYLYRMTVAFLFWQPQQLIEQLIDQRNYLAHPWQFALGLLSIALQIFTLRAISLIPFQIAEDSPGLEN